MQVLCSYSMKAVHPFFEAAGVSIHVLHMIDLRPYTEARMDVDGPMCQSMFLCNGGKDPVSAAVSAKNGVVRHERFENLTNIPSPR